MYDTGGLPWLELIYGVEWNLRSSRGIKQGGFLFLKFNNNPEKGEVLKQGVLGIIPKQSHTEYNFYKDDWGS